MSEINTENVEPVNDEENLDTFNDLFYGKEPAKKEETVVVEDVDDAPNDDVEEDTDLAPDATEEEKEAEQPKPKSRAEKRIEQLLEAARLEKERADALLKKLEEKEAAAAPKTPTIKDNYTGPHWDDKNEDGTEKYPLGQFDPAFNADYVKYQVEKELAEAREQDRIDREQREKEAAQKAHVDELTNSWNTKLEPAKERYPDFLEKGEELLDTFAGLDQAYGEYLTATLMSMEYGPDVLYYLANNLDEADRIVRLGPQGASVALGRLEAQFVSDGNKESKPRPKVSNAPAPPPTNRGSATSVVEVPDDTDDLDAFTAKFVKGL